jgi:hypothetical protein
MPVRYRVPIRKHRVHVSNELLAALEAILRQDNSVAESYSDGGASG